MSENAYAPLLSRVDVMRFYGTYLANGVIHLAHPHS